MTPLGNIAALWKQGLNTKEIADALDCAESYVANQLTAARTYRPAPSQTPEGRAMAWEKRKARLAELRRQAGRA